MKKQLLLLVMMLLPMVASADDSGNCGENVTYTYVESTHTLTISGTGAMANYSYGGSAAAPWYSYRSKIIKGIIEDGVTSIGEWAFNNCSNLTSITIPNSVTSIGYGAFYNCDFLTSVTIPNSVTSIGRAAFSNCRGLTSVTIPNSVTTIGYEAFSQCFGLTSVTISNGVISIGGYAFHDCRVLTSVTIGNSVTSIGHSAFSGCSCLKSISIPAGITTIEDETFSGCTGLCKVIIPNSVTSINQRAFSGCALDTLNLGNVSIGKEAFSFCSNLRDISLNFADIGDNAFQFCSSLRSVKIKTFSSIGVMAFADCSSLISLELGENLSNWSYIYGGAFTRCNSLVSVTIPYGVRDISGLAFEDCANLERVTISKTVYKIRNRCFGNCKKLENVICLAETVPTTESTAFSGSSIDHSTLYVPADVIVQYKRTAPWNSFNEIKEFQNTYMLYYFIDNTVYKRFEIGEGMGINPEPAPTKEGYTFSGWNEIPETMPAHDVTVTGTFNINKYKLTYNVDGEEYKSYEVEYGASITPEAEPTKEGYTFSGWSEIPETMPAHDVTVTGTFNINKYKLTYIVDGEEYKIYEVEYGATITPEAEPTKEGYTFRGWSEIPQTMPANDVTVNGTFSINKYKLTYTVDGEEYKYYEVEYGANITPESEPTKEGYTFSGWSEIPETMPAHDVTVTGSFSINTYKLTYLVNGEEYKSYEVEYGAAITAEAEPTKEGYTFSGWSEIPSTMPAHDVTVTGTFSINNYKLTYMIDDKVYKETMYEYGATIIPEPQPEGDYQTFEWADLPQTMPAHDVVVHASYTSEIVEVLMARQQNVRIYSPNGKKLNRLQKGLNIVILDDGSVKKVVIN